MRMRRFLSRHAFCARLSSAALAVGTSCPAVAQTCSADIPGGTKLQSPHYLIAYRPAPTPIPMGRHFTLDLVVCARDGAADPAGISVDANMPEHRHGMNYKTVVKPLGGGRYRAEGLMFHMPGRWELQFDVRNGNGESVRVTDTVLLK
jgi:hypothetical protein